MSIPHRIPRLLQLCVVSGFQLLVQLGLVIAMLDSKIDDLFRSFGVRKVEGGSGVELNVVR